MIPSIPRWIWLWATLLPVAAGSVNAIALLALHHGGVTHLTGVSTEGGIGLGSGDFTLITQAAAVIGFFTGGCALSAWLIRTPRWLPSMTAAALLLAEAGLLVLATHILVVHPWGGIMLCAGAIGVQNGTTSLVSGAVLRTSHLTGMFTDLGIAAGQWAWQGPVDRRRVGVCLVVIAGFVLGATIGTFMYGHWGIRALHVSAATAALVGVMTALHSLRDKSPMPAKPSAP